jgi:hypothetical protein
MSVVSLPVTRPAGRVLIVATAAMQPQPIELMRQLGFDCESSTDPYAAMAELCAKPLVYRAAVISLQSLYREELNLIGALKRRFPHLDIWLTHTDGRSASLADAMRLGADGLLADDGLHRIAPPAGASTADNTMTARPPMDLVAPNPLNVSQDEQTEPHAGDSSDDPGVNEPVLTADELRALLQEQPSMPPSGGSEN